MEHWAECFNIWSTSFGLRAAALMEGLNWTLKAPLDKKAMPLQAFAEFVRKSMQKREWKIARRLRSKKKLPALEDSMVKYNFGDLLSVFKFAQSAEARIFLLSEFEVAQAYRVSVLPRADVAKTLEGIQDRRGPSAARFAVILKLPEEEIGRFYLVMRNHGTQDVVYISPNSSLHALTGTALSTPLRTATCLPCFEKSFAGCTCTPRCGSRSTA